MFCASGKYLVKVGLLLDPGWGFAYNGDENDSASLCGQLQGGQADDRRA